MYVALGLGVCLGHNARPFRAVRWTCRSVRVFGERRKTGQEVRMPHGLRNPVIVQHETEPAHRSLRKPRATSSVMAPSLLKQVVHHSFGLAQVRLVTCRRTIPSVAVSPQCIKLAILPPHHRASPGCDLPHSAPAPGVHSRRRALWRRPRMQRARPNGLQAFACITTALTMVGRDGATIGGRFIGGGAALGSGAESRHASALPRAAEDRSRRVRRAR